MTLQEISEAMRPFAHQLSDLTEVEQSEWVYFFQSSSEIYRSSAPETRARLTPTLRNMMDNILEEMREQTYRDDHPLILMAKEAVAEYHRGETVDLDVVLNEIEDD